MLSYLYCENKLVSNIAIPELPAVFGGKTAFQFKLEPAQEQLADQHWSFHWLSSAGEKILSYGMQGFYHWLRFPGLMDFRISEDTKKISGYPLFNIPSETIRHLLLDQVLPRCLAHQGKLMLHASAVKIEEGILIFIGQSGTGKSTLAGTFDLAGHPAISDDVVYVTNDLECGIWAVPNYAGLRLWDDTLRILYSNEPVTSSIAHYSTKKRILFSRKSTSRNGKEGPILAFIVLTPQTYNREICLVPLTPREAFIEIINETFQFITFDINERSYHMEALGRIIPRVTTFRLSIPHDYELLPQVRQMILDKVDPKRYV